MRIKIINPNTTWSMTEKIGACARAVAHAGTEIVAASPAMGCLLYTSDAADE